VYSDSKSCTCISLERVLPENTTQKYGPFTALAKYKKSLHEFPPPKRTTLNHFKHPSAKAAKVEFLYLLKPTIAKYIPSYLAKLTQKRILEAFDLNTLTVLRAIYPYQAFSQDLKSGHAI